MREVKRSLVLLVGAIFLILGVIGFALPLLNGVVFFVIGMALLTLVSRRLRRVTDEQAGRVPRLRLFLRKTRGWLRRHVTGRVD